MEKNTHTPRPLHLAQAEPLLRERLEATVMLTVTGGSMLPLLAGGRDRVTLGPVPERLRRGEVLLYRRADGSYVLHRLTGFEQDGRRFVIIDTAGIRRKKAIEDATVERYSVIRSFAAIDRCDVALMVIDATQGVTEQDSKIAGYIDEQGKAAVIVVNKWDAKEKETGTLEKYVKEVREKLRFMAYAPVIFISAKTGQRVNRVLDTVRSVNEQASRRVTTGLLNDILTDAQTALQPPATSGRRLRIYYGTQQATKPPTFVLFVNDKELLHFSYERYLENQFRKAFGFDGTPIRFVLREREQKEE